MYLRLKYSQTCEKRPAKGETNYGLYRQVVCYLEVNLLYLTSDRLLQHDLYLQDGLYLEVVFNTGLTVNEDWALTSSILHFTSINWMEQLTITL